ncbi:MULTISPECIES: hypothetical protein [unclassified Okeania]|uniref:hypothetical protein n=1 Tax=unclassified Okeania TaxID=2634635 RepID=UPI0013BDD145|nr:MULTISPECIES: hypothetical protein [unclassified Okeania]NES74978.1 hypothetical protein [Okeania sp. SIO1H4]NES89328.1 hypothetical protein [Okeania sp. SIO2B9]NET18229.1 hypothetical protein [Okeania sp. SIO1H5]NET75250.1 hypothetical protein [Okeania sp. SIO1F9]NET92060.1 hypothetical protein [Okeania sp. SIO1H2]
MLNKLGVYQVYKVDSSTINNYGGRRQETGDRRQEKWIGSEEVGVRIVRMIFLP